MPFISKDWRSPGEHWVKTQEGWEQKKILECSKHSMRRQTSLDQRFDEGADSDSSSEPRRSSSLSDDGEDKENELEGQEEIQPHCHITIKNTREIAGFNALSDAFKRLDFRSAVHDVRRFNYVCALLELLVSQSLSSLSGCAQRVLLGMVEEVAWRVAASQRDLRTLDRLVRHLRKTVECACWGHPLGSTVLWEAHLQTIDRIRRIAKKINIREPGDDVQPKIENLPEECVREILLRMRDHHDLENSAQSWPLMARVVDEQRIWRELCQYHFPKNQLPVEHEDWQQVYHKLRKSLGLREEYAEMLHLCRVCRCLFWKTSGHPCINEQNGSDESMQIPISPTAFLQFFSL